MTVSARWFSPPVHVGSKSVDFDWAQLEAEGDDVSLPVDSRNSSLESSDSIMALLPIVPRQTKASCFDLLADDEVSLVLGALDVASLQAFACACQRAALLASCPVLWRTLLSRELHVVHWSVHDQGAIVVERRDIGRLLRFPLTAPMVWQMPRVQRGGSTLCLTLLDGGDGGDGGNGGNGGADLADVLAEGAAPAPPLGSRLQPRLVVSADGLSVRYVGERLGGNRAVRCEPALPSAPFDTLRFSHDESDGSPRLELVRACPIAYFEVSIGEVPASESASELDCIAIGLGSDAFPLAGRQPGWVRAAPPRRAPATAHRPPSALVLPSLLPLLSRASPLPQCSSR